jgi:hypothetical protein
VNSLTACIFFGGCAVLLLAGQLLGSRSELIKRAVRRSYTSPALLFSMRSAVGVMPLLAVASALLAICTLPPGAIGGWLAIAAIAVMAAAIAASYRVPPPFLPQWLRAEISQGVTALQRPSRWDWLMFWFLTPLFVLGAISLALLLVVFPEAG